MSIDKTLTHITLISQGGTSLGAFMAGVFFEIVRESLAEKHFAIDIITGASAGAMTATIASYYILKGEKKDFEDPRKNVLYQAWVDKADMKKIDPIIDLTQRVPVEEFEVFKKKENRKPLSLLSGYAIEDITKLVKETPEVINKPLAVLMTVTNLQGLIIQSSHGGHNKSVSNAEHRQFLFYPGLEKDKTVEFDRMWKKVITTCRASGAFPVAFPPIPDTSSPKSFNLQYLSDDYFDHQDSETNIFDSTLSIVENGKIKLNYSDGGILDNLPILKGVNLEASIGNISNSETKERLKQKLLMPRVENDANYSEFYKSLLEQYPELNLDYKRLHVYVQPKPISDIKSPERLTKTYFTMLETLFISLTSPHDEHEAIQLRQIIEIEEKVKLKKKLLEHINDPRTKQELEDIVPYNSIGLSPISPLVINMIEAAIKSHEKPTDIQIRLKKLEPIYTELINKDNIKQGLKAKDPSKLLASDFINSFGGFFDRKYREHDFLLGRICGITWLYANFDIEHSEEYIQDLKGEIDSKILSENPSINNLKWSSRTRIFRIILRFVRIAILESKSDKIQSIWDVLYLPLALIAALLLRMIDFITTMFLFVFDTLENVFGR